MSKERVAICPGSFDPVTYGHIDVIERASLMFDRLIISVFHNPAKKSMFSTEERVAIIKEAVKHVSNVEVTSFMGLLNEYSKQMDAKIIIRGLRALSDFEYEFQRALMIKKIDNDIETVFVMTNADYSFISSTAIKELAYFGADLTKFVPQFVQDRIYEKMKK